MHAAMTHRVDLEDERHDAGLKRRCVNKRKFERDGGIRSGHRLKRVGACSNGVLAELEIIVIVLVKRLVQADCPDDVGIGRF